MHYRDRAFITQKHMQGLSPPQIYARCEERLGWVGPLPSMAQIVEITRSLPRPRAVEPGSAREASQGAGTVIAGSAGPGDGWRPKINLRYGRRPWFVARQIGSKYIYFNNGSVTPARFASREEAQQICDQLNSSEHNSIAGPGVDPRSNSNG